MSYDDDLDDFLTLAVTDSRDVGCKGTRLIMKVVAEEKEEEREDGV